MKSISYLAALTGLFLAGCVVQPTAGPGNSTGNMCPPGQAKKGNCYPGGGFCPPGQQKKGGCARTDTNPEVEVQVSPGVIRVR